MKRLSFLRKSCWVFWISSTLSDNLASCWLWRSVFSYKSYKKRKFSYWKQCDADMGLRQSKSVSKTILTQVTPKNDVNKDKKSLSMTRGMSLLRSFSMKKSKKSQLKKSSVTNTGTNTLNSEYNSSTDLQSRSEISDPLIIENVGSFVDTVCQFWETLRRLKIIRSR